MCTFLASRLPRLVIVSSYVTGAPTGAGATGSFTNNFKSAKASLVTFDLALATVPSGATQDSNNALTPGVAKRNSNGN